MSHEDIDPKRAAQITERIGQAFDFVRDMIEDPKSLEDIPDGSTIYFRDVLVGETHFHLVAYRTQNDAWWWTARVTGPAHYAAEGRLWSVPPGSWGNAGKWGSPPTSPEGGNSATAALDALEEKLRDATESIGSRQRTIESG